MNKNHLTALGVAAALAVTLTACGTTPDPAASTPAASVTTTPAPSPTPTPLTPEQQAAALREANIEAAKARLREYYAVAGEVAQSGHQDWQARLSPYWATPEVAQALGDATQIEASAGLSFAGDPTVSSMTVTGYTEDPSGYSNERVSIDACMDYSGISITNSDGTAFQRPAGYQPRKVVQVVMYHLGADQPWAIGEFYGRDWAC
jgi:hypothetical protein